jgi:uncharacterized Zn-binding protein involved in type VI secretion
MGQPAAKQGDKIVAIDTHIVQPPGPVPPVPGPYPFNGIISGSLSTNVMIQGMPAATLGSTAINTPIHIPVGGMFVKLPSNQGTITMGSTTVLINNKPAARAGDTAITCNDPVDLPVGQVVAVSTVFIGG